jgi:hypothetical protein
MRLHRGLKAHQQQPVQLSQIRFRSMASPAKLWFKSIDTPAEMGLSLPHSIFDFSFCQHDNQ